MGIRDFFYINKSDRTAMAGLAVLAAIIMGLVFFLGYQEDTTPFSDADSLTINPFAEQNRRSYDRKRGDSHDFEDFAEPPKAELFPFDPNTATADELLRLGLKPWQVKNMMKYRSKGGVYRKPADFARLYGLTVEKFKQLEPYLRFTGDHRPASELFASENSTASSVSADEMTRKERDTLRYPVKIKADEFITIDMSELDTTTLRKVPGIGSYYARKIVDYGRQLGGFVSVEQLKEIDGFPEDALRYFSLGWTNIRKINLNKLTISQLRRHPYLNFYQARAIVDRRRLHGPLQSLDELRLLPEFPEEAITRLAPYVEF